MADPAVNPYDSIVADLASGQAAIGARNSVMSVADRNPDAEAQVQARATALGVPYESARNNPSIIGQRTAANAVDYDNLARTAPRTTQFLNSTSHAAIAQDDVGVLGTLENAISGTGSYLSQKFASGVHGALGVASQFANDLYGGIQNIGTSAQGVVAQGRAAIEGARTGNLKQFLLGDPGAYVRNQVQQSQNFDTGLQRFAIGQSQSAARIGQGADTAEGLADKSYLTLDPSKAAYLHPFKVVGDALQGLPPLAVLGASMALGRGEGAEAGLGTLGAYMGTGQQLDTLSSMPKEEIEKSPQYQQLVKEGVPPSSAEMFVRSRVASDQGFLTGGINTVLGGVGGSLSAKLFGKVGDGAISRILAGAGADGLTWGALGAGSQFGANLAEKADVNPDKGLLDNVGEAFASNLAQGGLFGAVTHAASFGAERQARVEQATETHQYLSDVMDLAAASKVRERAPETFHDLVGEMADGSPARDIYVDPHLLSEHLMQGDFEPDQKAAIESVIGPKIEEAIRQGTDAEIPVEDYATLLAGTDTGKALLDHIKIDPNGMTKAEADEFMATKGEALKAEIDKALEQTASDTDRSAEVDKIKAAVLEQMNGANRFTPKVNERYADLHAAFYDTTARRLGVSPNTLYERFPIRIVNRAMPDSHLEQPSYMQIDRDPSLRAAVKVDGKVYAAPDNDHFKALDQVPDSQRRAATLDGDNRGFATETGKFLTRAQAADYAREHKLFSPTAPDYAHAARELIGEHLAPPRVPTNEVTPEQFWHAVDNGGEFHQSDDKPIFYSELERAVESSSQAKASPDQWLATLAKTAGVKKEEIEWTELPEWLKSQQGPVTREELLAFVREGGVQVEEVDHGNIDEGAVEERAYELYDREVDAEFDNWWDSYEPGISEGVGPDGEPYWLLEGNKYDTEEEAEDERNAAMLRAREDFEPSTRFADYEREARNELSKAQFEDYTEEGGEDYHELLLTLPPGVKGNPERSPSTHFDEPGVVAHLRFKSRSTTDGKRLMFIEEVQSDWHQKGRDQGYEGDITDDQKADLLDAQRTAQNRIESSGEALANKALAALETELAKRPEVPEPKTPDVGDDKEAAELLEYLHRYAIQGNDTALRGQASWLRTQNADRPFSLELARYATEMAKAVQRNNLGNTVNRLKDDINHYRGDSMGRSAKNAVMSTHWPDDVPSDVKAALEDFKDAELKVNEAMQAARNVDSGIPDAPFKATWPALVMKRAIRYAADNGFEAVAWTTGDQQRERYNLSEALGSFDVQVRVDGRYTVRMDRGPASAIAQRGLGESEGGGVIHMTAEQIGEVFGKDLGSRMMALADQNKDAEGYGKRVEMSGDDLKIGGEGMNAFYDRNLVNITNNILKKLGGGKVEPIGVKDFADDDTDLVLAEAATRRIAALGGTDRAREIADQLYHADVANGTEISNPSTVLAGDVHYSSRGIENALKEAANLDNARASIPKNPGFAITPEMAQHAREGFALFQKNRGAYSPATDTISLLEHADLSTFLHESGHFYLEVLSRLADDPTAPQQIKDDFKSLLDWFGVKDRDEWRNMTLDQKRESHEKFARAFESYLFDGRAPSPKLTDLFRTFRAWLVAVYRHATGLGAKPTPEISGVMDRMLASDEEIRQAQAARSMEPLFKDQATSGMSEDQWKDYQRTNQTATQEAQSELSARSLRDMKWLDNARGRETSRLKRNAESIRKATRAEVETQVAAEPVYKAQRFLKRGEIDGEQQEGPHRLAIAHVDEAGHSADTKAKLGYGKYGMLGEEGLHPDDVAARFGFTSGDHLVKALTEAEPFKDRVAGLTEQRLLEEHGDLTDPQSIEEAASEAVHNQFRARAVAAELAALAKATGKQRLLAEAARQFAEETIARARIKDLKPAKYEAAAARAGREAMKALAKGDLNLAALEKRNQLFNTYAVKAARDALADVQRAVDHFNRIQRPAAQKNMRGAFRQQLAAMLDRFDLRSSVPIKATSEPLKPLNEWVQSEAERLSAVLPALPDFVLNEGFKTHYRALTIEQMRGLADSVKQIEMLARREQKQYMAIKGMEFDAEREKLLDAVRQSYPHAFDGITGTPLGTRPDFVPSIGKSLAKAGDKFVGEFLSTEHLAAMLDGGGMGAAHASLFSRMNERSDWKSKALGDIASEFKPLFRQWSFKEKRAYARQGTFIESIGNSLTRENMLVTALLAGSDDGRSRLNNYGWTDAHIEDITSHLDERDWRLADAIWRLFDENLWPQLRDLNMRTRGVSPPKVEAKPYATKFGMARGGYFRLKYDTELDERAHRMDEGQQVKELLGGTTGMGGAKTAQGTSIERVDNVTMRPRLDLGVFNETVNETVHDLAYREAVADTMRVLNDTQIQSALKGALGTAGYRAFVAHVRDVAAPPRNPMGFVEKAISVARRNTITNMMSGVVTALVHFHGIVPAFTKINPGILSAEIAKSFWLPSAIDRYKFASETSQFMAQRTSNLDRDMGKRIDQLTVKGKLLPGSEVFLALMTHIHKAIDSIVWNAAFKEGMKLNANDSDAALAHADHTVRQTQGSGRDVDLPSIMAGHGGWGELKKAFTMFQSYFNSQLQILVQAGAVAKQEARDNPARASARFAAKFLMISVVPGLLYEALFSRDQPDDGETSGAKALRYLHAVVEYNAGFVPLLRDIVPEVWAQFDHAEPDYGYKVSPLQSAGEAVFQKAPHSATKIAAGKADAQDIKNMIVAGGFLTGTPGKLAADVALGTDAVLTGREGPAAIAFGPAHHKAAKRY